MGIDAAAPLLDEASVAMIQSPQSAKLVAAADSALLASGAHAYACRVAPDRRSIAVVVSRTQSAVVLDSIAVTRRVALVACHIRTYQTVQVKGDDALIQPAGAADRQALEDFCRGFVEYSASLGYERDAMRVHMFCDPADAVVVCFTARRAFNQTPGPAAGQPLAGAP